MTSETAATTEHDRAYKRERQTKKEKTKKAKSTTNLHLSLSLSVCRSGRRGRLVPSALGNSNENKVPTPKVNRPPSRLYIPLSDGEMEIEFVQNSDGQPDTQTGTNAAGRKHLWRSSKRDFFFHFYFFAVPEYGFNCV